MSMTVATFPNHPAKITHHRLQTVCFIGFFEKYKELAKYNVRELTSPKVSQSPQKLIRTFNFNAPIEQATQLHSCEKIGSHIEKTEKGARQVNLVLNSAKETEGQS
ncbi:Uncharacterized protein Fot_53842 [Forsythia ovata]|uniref:Uncharacterized protein n=1 Tax=Forsythia ovata TaxID=205694 RepID=A0ABD1PFC5_9LAMI